jgi:hypothetical protein
MHNKYGLHFFLMWGIQVVCVPPLSPFCVVQACTCKTCTVIWNNVLNNSMPGSSWYLSVIATCVVGNITNKKYEKAVIQVLSFITHVTDYSVYTVTYLSGKLQFNTHQKQKKFYNRFMNVPHYNITRKAYTCTNIIKMYKNNNTRCNYYYVLMRTRYYMHILIVVI